MRHLLDTHILLWARLDTARLNDAQQQIISDKSSVKVISSVTIWEISLKFGLGKLDLGGRTPEEFLVSAEWLGFEIAAPTVDCFASFHALAAIPGHKDPFDRMLIWQAMHDGFTLLSSDAYFKDYKLAGLRLA